MRNQLVSVTEPNMPKIAFGITNSPLKFAYEFKCFECLKEWLVGLEPKELKKYMYRWYRCPICRGEIDKWYQPITKGLKGEHPKEYR